MIKKISCIIIIVCIYSVQTNAQINDHGRRKIIKLLQNIQNNIGVIDRNLSGACAKKVLDIPKEFQKSDTSNLISKNVSQLLKAAKLFIRYKSPGESCSNKKAIIKKYDDATKRLVNELKTVIHQIENSTKNKVQLNISVIDERSNKPLNTIVTIVPAGSLDTLKIPLRNYKDTTGFSTALLPSGNNYIIMVNDSQYVHYYTKINIVRDSGITIKLQRIISDATANYTFKDSTTRKNESQFGSVKKFIESRIFWFVSIAVIFFLIFAGVVLYIIRLIRSKAKSEKKYEQSMLTISELKASIKVKETMTDTSNNELPATNFPTQIKKEQLKVLPAKQNLVVDTSPVNRNFICEIMMTAGPRKKFMNEPNADKDLGEDVCGFVSDTKNVLFWVLDGTSDLHCLKNPIDKREYFSSRLLAQLLGENIRNAFTEKSENVFDKIVVKAIEEVKKDFLKKIDQLPDEEKKVLKKNIENKNFPECAATVLIGRLSLNGDFSAYRSGDSKMLLFSITSVNEIDIVESSLEVKNDQSNDRLFLRLILDGNGKFDIFFNQPEHEIVNKKNINATISFSDGIGINTELLLKEEYQKNPFKIRKEIAYQIQGTGDDKTICFIEIKETR